MINRKPLLFVVFLLLFLVKPSFIASAADTFGKGSTVISLLGNGGMMDTPDDLKLAYGGKLSFEFGVADLFGDKGALGLAIVLSDLYDGKYESANTGSYNYSYTTYTYTREKNTNNDRYHIKTSTATHQRKGDGMAECDVHRNDATVMAGISLHYEPAQYLDTYLMVGGGVTFCTRSFSNYRNAVNISKVDHMEEKPSVGDYDGPVISYYYNDFDHVKWDGFGSKFYPAAMALLGMRYYFTDHVAVNVEAGLNAFTIKENLNAMTLGSVGVSFKF